MNKKDEKKNNEFKLPRYLKLDKGAMFLDIEGENCSGVRLYSMQKVFIGREIKTEQYVDEKDGKTKLRVLPTEIAKDEHDNKNLLSFGSVKSELPWYCDTTKIPPEKLSRILIAYKYGILVEADPNNPPQQYEEQKIEKDFGFKQNGDRIFIGKNKEMFKKLQNNDFKTLKSFIITAPMTSAAKQNLIDLLDYEQKGHNPISRPRLEVLDLIKNKLKEYGPSMSAIRINED